MITSTCVSLVMVRPFISSHSSSSPSSSSSSSPRTWFLLLLSLVCCAFPIHASQQSQEDVSDSTPHTTTSTTTHPMHILADPLPFDINTPTTLLLPARYSLPLTLTHDALHYTIPISVGTPPQILNVMFDTGNAELMLITNGTWCTSSNPCYQQNISSTTMTLFSGHIYALSLDGELIHDSDTTIITDIVSLALNIIGTNIAWDRLSQRVDVATAGNLRSIGDDPDSSSITFGKLPRTQANSLKYVSGIMGAAYAKSLSSDPNLRFFTSDTYAPWLNLLTPISGTPLFPIFAMDVNGRTGGRLDIGGIDDAYRDRIVWGTRQTNPDLHTSTIAKMKICGQDLIPAGTHQPMIVDTGSSCLTLPCETFDALMSWLPVRCASNKRDFSAQEYSSSAQPIPAACGLEKICYIPSRYHSGVYNESLPILQFGFTQNGTLLSLPLSSLLLPWNHSEDNNINKDTMGDMFQRLCIHRGGSKNAHVNGYVTPIVFGSRTLSSFYTVFDMETGQIGMAQKQEIRSSSIDLQCVIRRSCMGMQRHDSPSNLCIDPSCDDYYFFELDPVEKTCHLSSSFHILVGILISIFICIETGLNELLMSMSNKIETTVPLY